MSYILAFLGFVTLIVLHEAGHFAAAKAVGMRVERFSLFFPPLLARVRRGETEYAIGAVPLGGYVKISGMSPREEIPPRVIPEAYFRQKVWKRIVVIAAGPFVNLLIAFVVIAGLFHFQGDFKDAVAVDQVTPHSAASGVLKEGDKIVSVGGVRGYEPGLTEKEILQRQKDLRAVVSAHVCPGSSRAKGCQAIDPVTFVIERGGKRETLKIRPRYDPAAGRMLVGFGYGSYAPVSVPRAAQYSGQAMWNITKLTASAITKIFYDPQARKQVSGVVGSYETTRSAIQLDAATALRVLAIISLSLAVVNLFPFLPLDGGHIFWALAEKVRRRPISFAIMERASVFGFLLVMFIFVIGLSNDIGRLNGEGFNIR